MKSGLISLMLFIVAFRVALGSDSPKLSRSPLSSEQLEIYGAFLESYSPDPFSVADKTDPFTLSDAQMNFDCMKGVAWERVGNSRKTIHKLPREIAQGRKFKLIDASKEGQNVVSVSEIVFDKQHRFAAFQYSFRCGILCGWGIAVVFEKEKGGWRNTGLECFPWIS